MAMETALARRWRRRWRLGTATAMAMALEDGDGKRDAICADDSEERWRVEDAVEDAVLDLRFVAQRNLYASRAHNCGKSRQPVSPQYYATGGRLAERVKYAVGAARIEGIPKWYSECRN